MRILRMYPTSINDQYIDMLVDALREGEVIVIPTDNRYVLACDALNNRAVQHICEIRNIDTRRHPLSIICDNLSQASEYVMIDNRAFKILKESLPGPFTFILPASHRLPKVFKGRREVGLRIPDNPIARRLAAGLGNPLMASTAGWQGADDEDTLLPEAIADALANDVAYTIDTGEAPRSMTTVIDITDSLNPVTLRQ
ncbi:MAG: L-threonylcarbamoyladenylate synthase [Clostridiales bacterium]|nr:L-threonylcarbamoyladenylate synthase [Clostridiales bacterium]